MEGVLDERKMEAQLGRLVFLPVLANPKALDFRFESRPWNPEFGSRARRSGNAAMALGQSSFDCLHFTIQQRRNPFSWLPRLCRFDFQPALIHEEGVRFTENDRTFHDVLQFTNIPRPIVGG